MTRALAFCGAVLILAVKVVAQPEPVAVDARFAGAEACAACHVAQSLKQKSAPMGRALQSVAECHVLRAHPRLSFEEGSVKSEIVRAGEGSRLTVSWGKESMTVPLLWAFGEGQAGQTYVFERDGAFYESRVSFYQSIGGLDLTMGAANLKPQTLVEFAGRKMDSVDTRDCFGCHSTAGVRKDGMHWDALTAGVRCEQCHGPAAQHVEAMRGGKPGAGPMAKLGRLSTEELSDFCGACHRTWSEIAANGPHDSRNVRFQPYRLANSKCYDAADTRIRCTACHDPHERVQATAAYYDQKCGACHRASAAGHARVCKAAAKSNCVSCHMPKVDLQGAHFQFTDHWIRVVKTGAVFPN